MMIKILIIFFSFIFSQCPENFIESIQSTADNIVCLPTQFEHTISTQQAGYFFSSIDIDNESIDNNDWIGAFNQEVCVGAAQWDLSSCSNGICSIVVYGYDGNEFSQGYMLQGEIPTFKIYDTSQNEYYLANTSSNESWFNFQVFFINQLTNQIFGCTDNTACNFNIEADVDDGSCEYDSDNDGSCDSQDICPGFNDFLDTDNDNVVDCLEVFGCTDFEADNYNLDATENNGLCVYSYNVTSHIGPNLLSYYVLPDIELTYPSLEFVNLNYTSENLIGIIGDNSSISFSPNGILVGSLVDIDRAKGYWVKMSFSDTLLFSGYRTSLNLNYSLTSGANLISFPSDGVYAFEDAFPASLDGIVTSVIGEGISAVYEDGAWFGSLTEFEGFKGYWFISSDAVDFQFDLDDTGALARSLVKPKQYLSGYEYGQSTAQSFYYIKDVPSAESGDWIVAYSNDGVVVGAREWNGYMTDVPVMGYDGEDYSLGYLESQECPEFKLYKSSTGQLIDLYSEGQIQCFANNATPVLNKLLDTQAEVANSVKLKGAYPNPFNPVTNIQFDVMSTSANVEINILDIQGRLVDRLVNSEYGSGTHDVAFSAELLSSGIYFVQLISDKNISYTKIVLLK